jgi:hypothetical protein
MKSMARRCFGMRGTCYPKHWRVSLPTNGFVQLCFCNSTIFFSHLTALGASKVTSRKIFSKFADLSMTDPDDDDEIVADAAPCHLGKGRSPTSAFASVVSDGSFRQADSQSRCWLYAKADFDAYIMVLLKYALARSIELQSFDGATETYPVSPSFDLSASTPSRAAFTPAGFGFCAVRRQISHRSAVAEPFVDRQGDCLPREGTSEDVTALRR